MDGSQRHVPVMLEEAVQAVLGDPDGRYVDATFGLGGHARRLLAELSSKGRLVVIDRDGDAIAEAGQLARADSRVSVCHGRFGALHDHLQAQGSAAAGLDGVLFDVGVSSPQLDAAERGFGFAQDGPLDMRMDRREPRTAADWLNDASERDIASVLRRYGQQPQARRVARAIVESRPLATTGELAAAVARSAPAMAGGRHVATRVFQAVRIQVNDELNELDKGLAAAFEALAGGGRLAAITFHSLEHGLVRRRFRNWTAGPGLPRRLPVPGAAEVRARRVAGVGKGARPSEAEVRSNPRARSALLQAVERIEAAA